MEEDTHLCTSLSLNQIPRRILHTSLIPINPQPNNTSHSLIRQITNMPKRLPSMHIGNMNLNKRNRHSHQRIPNRNASMRQRTRVNQHGIEFAPRGVDAIYDRAFVVGLECFEVDALGGGEGLGRVFDVEEGCCPVEMGFAGSQEVEVGAVDEEDSGHFGGGFVWDGKVIWFG